MLRSFHSHLHPSFVLVLSSHQCEKAQETLITMGLLTDLLFIREHSLEKSFSGETLFYHVQENPLTNHLLYTAHQAPS